MYCRLENWIAAGGFLLAVAATGCSSNVPDVPEYVLTDPDRVARLRATLIEGTGGGGAVVENRPDPQGWGTLAGTITLPAATATALANRPTLRVEDAACLRSGPIRSEQVIVDPSTGGLKNVVIFFSENTDRFANADKWVHPDMVPGANTTPVPYDQVGCVFTTHVLALQVAQPLLIRNSDTVGHNTKLGRGINPISPSLAPGGEAEPYLHEEEDRTPYTVTCNIHPWMKAYIISRSNGYFAVTDEAGKFSIENLPAEVDFTMKFWHEKVGFLNMDVTVNGQQQSWKSKGVNVKVPQAGETVMDVVLDGSKFQ